MRLAAETTARPIAERSRCSRPTGFVSIGDLPIAQHLSPALTTIGVDIEQMGRKSAELLLERLDNPSLPPRKHYLDYKLIVRESSAEPKTA